MRGRAADRRPARRRRIARPAAGGPSVLAWEDDPLSVAAGKAIPAPVPALGAKPYPLALTGTAPAPKAYAKETADFRYWNAAVALRRGADFWGALVPAGTKWEPGGTLKVTLDHGVELNAYYDRKGLWFFHEKVAGQTVYSGESPDVLCHELGHAILDSVRPELWDAMSAEVAAFHEAFGDVSSLLAGLQVPTLRKAVLSETGGILYRASRLSRLAEQLGWAIRQGQPDAVDRDCLRNAVNSFFYRDPLTIPPYGPASHLTSEPHSFSRVFTAGFFEALGGMVSTIASPATDAALVSAGRDAGALLVDAIRSAPVVPGYYSQVAAHMISADEAHFSGKYSSALRSAFVRRGILSLKAAAELRPETVRPAVRGRAAAAAAAGVKTVSLPADDFALGAGRIHVQSASGTPALRASSAAPSAGPVPEATDEAAAQAFLEYLFRRGRVDLRGQGDAATRVEHPHARKTHRLKAEGVDFTVARHSFDCGFDFA